MSSPPPSALSPTGSTGFSLPKKRGPAVQIPAQAKRRKPSSVSSASHPLRQTSFPPPENSARDASPLRQGSFSPSVSSVGGRGKGKKRRPGAARSTTAVTAKSGDDRIAGPNDSQAAGATGREEEDAEDDEDEGALDTLLEGGALMSDAARKQEHEHEIMLLEAFSPDQRERHEYYRRVKMKEAILKKLVNQVLSQSVQQNVVKVINGYTKVFMGDLIERARDVQEEWLVAEKMSENPQHPGAKASKPATKQKDVLASNETSQPLTAAADGQTTSNAATPTENTQSAEATQDAGFQSEPETQLETSIILHVDERDRGPLTPEHLREALRRYQKDRVGGSAGFQGMSMLGREMTASRTGGRRLFR